jgi:hypothetical protein
MKADLLDAHSKIYFRDGGICQTCGRQLEFNIAQKAHRIKKGRQSENYVVKYFESKHGIYLTHKKARDILNHDLNLKLTCPGYCNDAQNIFYDPIERDKLLDIIKEVLYDQV